MANIVRVMISSTARDLTEYRSAIMDACLSLGCFPSMMEYLPALHADAVAASLNMVDGADIYIGIFAHRYGYIPLGYDKSITELEYDRATDRAIPILVFIIDEKARVERSMIESGEGDRKLQILKDKLKQNHVVKFFNTPEDLAGKVMQSLWYLLPKIEENEPLPTGVRNEASTFSDQITNNLAKLYKDIDKLTEEQYQVLNILRYQHRATIAGCAGSGKTLLAAEKAIRLDNAGLKTMILCHSYYLANYIGQLVAGTGVFVNDFTSWIDQLNGNSQHIDSEWTQYQEPTIEEVTLAFDQLVDSSRRFDAILVDEGQDFRDEWWLIVEAALSSQEYGILYIFCDDNQALLPQRSTEYPVPQAPFQLSKNCRNAGAIFDIVRRFHPQSPEPSLVLKGQGLARRWIFDEGQELTALGNAVRELKWNRNSAVILTTESDPVQSSILYNRSLMIPPYFKWQDLVLRTLSEFSFHEKLSDSEIPNTQDIKTVVSFSRHKIREMFENPDELNKRRGWGYWENSDNNIVFFGDTKAKLAMFASEDWGKRLPEPDKIIISNQRFSTLDTLKLYTVSTFKGLEADFVILFVPSPRENLDALIYVGLSRAKFALYIVIGRSLIKRVEARHVLVADDDRLS